MGLSRPWAAHFLPASRLCQGDSSCFLENASPHIPTPMASPASSRCSINAPSFTRPSLLPGSPPATASGALRSRGSEPVRPLHLPCPVLLSRGHRSNEVPLGILAGQVPPPLRRPPVGFHRALKSQTQSLGGQWAAVGAEVGQECWGRKGGEPEAGGKPTTFTITSPTRLPSAPATAPAGIPGAGGQQGRDLGSGCKE